MYSHLQIAAVDTAGWVVSLLAVRSHKKGRSFGKGNSVIILDTLTQGEANGYIYDDTSDSLELLKWTDRKTLGTYMKYVEAGSGIVMHTLLVTLLRYAVPELVGYGHATGSLFRSFVLIDFQRCSLSCAFQV